MGMYVFADPPAKFKNWLRQQSADASSPGSADQQRGQKLFLDNACASCHTIRGTSAKGDVGPDLTHVASRTSLASVTIPNTPAELSAWIRDPQHIKPGTLMPGLNLSSQDFSSIAAYLESLR
jgi:cytochrome c oxidase subunit II